MTMPIAAATLTGPSLVSALGVCAPPEPATPLSDAVSSRKLRCVFVVSVTPVPDAPPSVAGSPDPESLSFSGAPAAEAVVRALEFDQLNASRVRFPSAVTERPSTAVTV